MSLSGLKISRVALLAQLEAKLKEIKGTPAAIAKSDAAYRKEVETWKRDAVRLLKGAKNLHQVLTAFCHYEYDDDGGRRPVVYQIQVDARHLPGLRPYPAQPVKMRVPDTEELERTIRILKMSTADTVNAALAKGCLDHL